MPTKDATLKYTKLMVRYSRTFNLGDYNSVKLEAEIECPIGPNDEPREVAAQCWEFVKEEVRAAYEPVRQGTLRGAKKS